MRMWPSKEEQGPKLQKKSSFVSKEVLHKTPPKCPNFSCEWGKCTEKPKLKVQTKYLHLLLQNSGQLYQILFCAKTLSCFFIKYDWVQAAISAVPFSRSLADAVQRPLLSSGRSPLPERMCCPLQQGNALLSRQVVSGQRQVLPYLPCT